MTQEFGKVEKSRLFIDANNVKPCLLLLIVQMQSRHQNVCVKTLLEMMLKKKCTIEMKIQRESIGMKFNKIKRDFYI